MCGVRGHAPPPRRAERLRMAATLAGATAMAQPLQYWRSLCSRYAEHLTEGLRIRRCFQSAAPVQ